MTIKINPLSFTSYCVLGGKEIDGEDQRVSIDKADVFLASGFSEDLSMCTIREFKFQDEAERYLKILLDVKKALIKASLMDCFESFPESESAYHDFISSSMAWNVSGFSPQKNYKQVPVETLKMILKSQFNKYAAVADEVIEIAFVEIEGV